MVTTSEARWTNELIGLWIFPVIFGLYPVDKRYIAIENGRWHKPRPTPVDERKCMFCDDIEDEYHFLFVFVIIIHTTENGVNTWILL